MCVDLVQVAEELTEAMFGRDAGRSGIAQAPFTEAAAAVTRTLQHVRDRHVVGSQRDRARIRANRRVAAVKTCHQDTTRGCADSGARVDLRELQALRGEPIEV